MRNDMQMGDQQGEKHLIDRGRAAPDAIPRMIGRAVLPGFVEPETISI